MSTELKPQHEVQDADHWAFFHSLFGDPVEWHLPAFDVPFYGKFQVTKFMVLELIAAALVILIFVPLALMVRRGGLPKGRFWNFFEVFLVFIRDEIARPNLDSHHDHEGHAEDEKIAGGHHSHAHGHEHEHNEYPPALASNAGHHHGHHEGDKYVPFLWTIFMFILFCNLLGMIPMAGSPTASIWVTGALGVIAFGMLHGAPIAKVGAVNYFKALWPKFEMGDGLVFTIMGWVFSIGIGMIEILGSFIKSGVLAIRLFANMFAGHLVLAFILFFIYQVHEASNREYTALWSLVTVSSILGVVALSLLELFVAFLQAYIFTFLLAVFMGMSIHHAEAH